MLFSGWTSCKKWAWGHAMNEHENIFHAKYYSLLPKYSRFVAFQQDYHDEICNVAALFHPYAVVYWGVPCTSSEFHLLNDHVVFWFLLWAEWSILRKEHLFISCHVGGRSVPLLNWVVSNETWGMVLLFRLLECDGFVAHWHSNGLACYHFILQCEPSWSEENSMVSNSCNAFMWCDLDYAFDHPLNHISWT